MYHDVDQSMINPAWRLSSLRHHLEWCHGAEDSRGPSDTGRSSVAFAAGGRLHRSLGTESCNLSARGWSSSWSWPSWVLTRMSPWFMVERTGLSTNSKLECATLYLFWAIAVSPFFDVARPLWKPENYIVHDLAWNLRRRHILWFYLSIHLSNYLTIKLSNYLTI